MEFKIRKVSLLVSRFFAFTVDLIIVSFLLIYYWTHYSFSSDENILPKAFLTLVFSQFYFFTFELLFNATPGKFLFGLRVKNSSIGQDTQSSLIKIFKRAFNLFVRNFTRVLVLIPPLFIWNELLILIFSKGISFGELLTNFRVDFKHS